MSATTDADGDGEFPSHVRDALDRARSERLQRKIKSIYRNAQEAEQEKTLDIEVYYADSDLTSIKVKSAEEERTITSHRAVFVLGPRGGVRTASFSTLGGRVELADRSNPWRRIGRRLRRMR